MRLLDHPAVQHALRSVDSLLNNYTFINGEQARQIIVVEMTYEGEASLRDCEDYSMVHFVPENRTPAETLRATDLNSREGPLTIMGVRFYRVDYLRNGDTWRVRNALGVI